MGIMIIVGVMFLSYVLYQRITGVGHFAKSQTDTLQSDLNVLVKATQSAAQPMAVALHLGNDAQVVSIHEVNSRLLLLIRQPKTGDRLYLLEPKSGAILSAIGIGDTVPPLPDAAAALMPPTVKPPVAAASPAPVPAPAPAVSMAKPPSAGSQTQLVPATKPANH